MFPNLPTAELGGGGLGSAKGSSKLYEFYTASLNVLCSFFRQHLGSSVTPMLQAIFENTDGVVTNEMPIYTPIGEFRIVFSLNIFSTKEPNSQVISI